GRVGAGMRGAAPAIALVPCVVTPNGCRIAPGANRRPCSGGQPEHGLGGYGPTSSAPMSQIPERGTPSMSSPNLPASGSLVPRSFAPVSVGARCTSPVAALTNVNVRTALELAPGARLPSSAALKFEPGANVPTNPMLPAFVPFAARELMTFIEFELPPSST